MNALTWPAVLAVLLMPAAAAAQDRTAPRAAAADPAAATVPLRHRSALSSYRRSGGEDPPTVPWREANDSVGRIGGWRAYAREAQAGAAPASAPVAPAAPAAAPATPPRPGGHAHHGSPDAAASGPRR